MYNNLEKNHIHMYNLKKKLINGIMSSIDDVYVNGTEIGNKNNANHILNMRFDNVRGEVLLHSLESKGIYVSTGSACSKGSKSVTLKEGLGLTDDQVDNSVRFSFSKYNTEEDIDYCISQIKEIVPMLRRFVRK
jgi:cysteine desulfurase